MTSRKELIAPCGIDCANCEMYLAAENEDIKNYLISKGIPESILPCKACLPSEGKCPLMKDVCPTYSCIQSKNARFCFECSDYPCSNLYPCYDRADILPHNLKILNLSIIEHQGIEAFICKSLYTKKMYFKGKMQIGKGPHLE